LALTSRVVPDCEVLERVMACITSAAPSRAARPAVVALQVFASPLEKSIVSLIENQDMGQPSYPKYWI